MCGAVVDLEEVLPVVLESLGDQVDQHFVLGVYGDGLAMKFARENIGEQSESVRNHHALRRRPDRRRGPDAAQAAKFTPAGDGLCVGFDSGDNVTERYENPGTFTGGTILGVAINVSDEAYLDLECEAAGAFARD